MRTTAAATNINS